MKITHLLVAALLCSISVDAVAQGKFSSFQPKNYDAPKMPAPQLQKGTVSEHLIGLARLNQANIIADATFFSDSPKDLSLSNDKSFIDWLMELGYTDNLSLGKLDEKTFLVWGQPNVPSVANALIAKTRKLDEANGPEPKTDYLTSRRYQRVELILADYLQDAYDWDGKSKDLNVDFELSKMPSEEADTLIDIMSSVAKNNERANVKGWASSDGLWLSDELWQNAAVGYFQTPDGETVLAVRGASGNQELFSSIIWPATFPQVNWSPTPASDVPAVAEPQEKIKKLTSKEIQGDKSLDLPLTLELKGASLNSALKEISAQSKVKLVEIPGLLASKKVTMAISAMPLSQVMNALTQLYGIAWSKQTDGSYLAQEELSPAEIDALQLGDYQLFRYWNDPIQAEYAPATLNLPAKIDLKADLNAAGVDQAQLTQPQGVKLSSLPVELQRLIRSNIEETFGWQLLVTYRKVFLDTTPFPADVTSALVQIRPATVGRTATIGKQVIDLSPLLNVNIVAEGEPVYSLSISNQKQRDDARKQLVMVEEFDKARRQALGE